jgi:hypothetical protein
MTQHDNLAEDQEQYRRYLIDTFGPDSVVGLATDIEPGTTKSAEQHAQRRKANDREAVLDQVDETVALARGLYADQAAYDRVMAGGNGQADKIATARYTRSQGLVPVQSSAQRLAAPSLARRQWEPVDDDQDATHDRRQGRRPRS